MLYISITVLDTPHIPHLNISISHSARPFARAIINIYKTERTVIGSFMVSTGRQLSSVEISEKLMEYLQDQLGGSSLSFQSNQERILGVMKLSSTGSS